MKKIHFINTTSLPSFCVAANLGDKKTLKTPAMNEANKYANCGNKKFIIKRKVMNINPNARKLNKKARVLADNIIWFIFIMGKYMKIKSIFKIFDSDNTFFVFTNKFFDWLLFQKKNTNY